MQTIQTFLLLTIEKKQTQINYNSEKNPKKPKRIKNKNSPISDRIHWKKAGGTKHKTSITLLELWKKTN